MFVVCHFKDTEEKFILYDKNDLKEITQHMNIEIDKELSFDELKNEYASFPLIYTNDMILRGMNKKARTNTHVLDELNLSNFNALEREYNKVLNKKSYLSKSQRDIVVEQYNIIQECNG